MSGKPGTFYKVTYKGQKSFVLRFSNQAINRANDGVESTRNSICAHIKGELRRTEGSFTGRISWSELRFEAMAPVA